MKIFRVEITIPIYDVEAETEEEAIECARDEFLSTPAKQLLREASCEAEEVRPR